MMKRIVLHVTIVLYTLAVATLIEAAPQVGKPAPGFTKELAFRTGTS